MAENVKMSAAERREDRRRRAVLGTLPESSLRIPVDEEPLTEEERDREMALALQRQLNYQQQQQQEVNKNVTGRLTVTIAEAKLARNYGVTRMDPYCRIRVGHQIYETPTCSNGAKEPKWNKTINCFTLPGTKSIDVEIYDECTFSTDALIAHASLPLPECVLKATEMSDEWWPLTGQEGEGKEGMLHLVLSMQLLPQGGVAALGGPVVQVAPSLTGSKPMEYTPIPLQQQQQQQQQQQPQMAAVPAEMSEADLEEFSKMFPGVEKTVIKEIYADSMGDKEATVNSLLQLGQ